MAFRSLLVVLLLAAPVWAGEFPPSSFPPASALERDFREARRAERENPQAAVAAYRRLLRARKFPAPGRSTRAQA